MTKIETFQQFLASGASEIPFFAFLLNLFLVALLSFFLSLAYQRFGHTFSNRKEFSNNFLLLSLSTMIVITIVKSSLALSLGLVGALSIVRFRAAIKEPEELTFLFLAIAIGLGIIAWTRWIQKRFPWKKKKIYFIPTGSNIPRTICSYSAESFRKKNGIARTATVLATFISIGSGRGIEFVSQFWREIREIYPETTLVLLGGGNLPATSKLVCDPRVLVTDFLSSEKVSNWLSNSDIYIAHFDDGITCRRGSLMAALEHSLPVVSNRGFQWDKEVFENSPVTLADLNPESFIEAIRPLIINADFRKKQGELTRKFFESNFSWSVLTAQLFPWAQSKDPN